ncbi:hypothetical protein BGZ81_011417 [Podila clonocystis]|nr:hypothetical protein BGZ81_011417 [Podila clonocystis]
MSKPSTTHHDDSSMTTTPQDQVMDASQTDTEMSQAIKPHQVKEALTPPNSTTQNSTGGMFKRPRPKSLTKHSIHRPFKSPLKTSISTTTHPLTSVDTSASTTNPRAMQAKELSHRALSIPPIPQPKAPLPKPKARPQFRSPLPRNPGQSSSSSSSQGQNTSVGRFLEIKDLESKISELRSSIRNCTMVLRHQEKKDDTPIEELIAKWKHVSQKGAQALLEKMVEQEQAFSDTRGYNDYYGSSSLGQGSGYTGLSETGTHKRGWT